MIIIVIINIWICLKQIMYNQNKLIIEHCNS